MAFRKRTWKHAQQLLVGAILCPGSRTVCNVLRVLGLEKESPFHKYHRVLSMRKWSARKLADALLGQLVSAFVGPDEALVFGIDETIERRWGSRIQKRGIYRDPVRSSGSHFVKCSGLRWMSLMLLTRMPWLQAGPCWALPSMTALCPSQRYYEYRPLTRRPKQLTDWARQFITYLGRWTKRLSQPVYLVGGRILCHLRTAGSRTRGGHWPHRTHAPGCAAVSFSTDEPACGYARCQTKSWWTTAADD